MNTSSTPTLSTLLPTLALSLLLFLSLPSHSLSAKPRCHPTDRKTLLQIKNSFNDPNPSLPSWNPAITTDCCEWYGVGCDLTTNRVISISIFSTNLSGQIPASIALLPSLQTLILRKLPYLTGPIPSAIAQLSNLNMLRLSWTNLSGPVPSFLSQLKNLTFLDLAFNNLNGSIPVELDQLPQLYGIHLDRNKLTGPIPDWNFQSGTAPDIYLSHNKLTGPVPKSFGYYNYSTVDLSRNMLSGDLSFMFGSNKTVQIVDFSRNLFEFNLSDVVFPASLTSLDLNHNKIFGSLPAELTALEFQYLNVSYNRLCGKIPTGGKLQSFDVTSYFHNRCLCGNPLPAC
ncbi:polygalacturonase inhibitor-like [Rhododendron vialii]|nr:polygalacturonase inhibitor-like [Rhododendron vialii]